MAIPWVTAFYVFKKVLPVVIDKAPELLKTLERRRTQPAPSELTRPEYSLAMVQERLEALEQLITDQALRGTRRSLALAWAVLAAAVLLGTSLALVAFLRS